MVAMMGLLRHLAAVADPAGDLLVGLERRLILQHSAGHR